MPPAGVGKEKLAFSYDVQHHSERRESSDHVEQRHRVLNVQALLSCSKVEEADQQGHEQGLQAVHQQGDQVSVVVVDVAPGGEDAILKTGRPTWAHGMLGMLPEEDSKLL